MAVQRVMSLSIQTVILSFKNVKSVNFNDLPKDVKSCVFMFGDNQSNLADIEIWLHFYPLI